MLASLVPEAPMQAAVASVSQSVGSRVGWSGNGWIC